MRRSNSSNESCPIPLTSGCYSAGVTLHPCSGFVPCRCDDPTDVLGGEKFSDRRPPSHHIQKTISVCLVSVQGRKEPLHLGRRRCLGGQLAGKLIHGNRFLIPLLFVSRKCLLQRATTAETIVECSGQQFGVPEG